MHIDGSSHTPCLLVAVVAVYIFRLPFTQDIQRKAIQFSNVGSALSASNFSSAVFAGSSDVHDFSQCLSAMWRTRWVSVISPVSDQQFCSFIALSVVMAWEQQDNDHCKNCQDASSALQTRWFYELNCSWKPCHCDRAQMIHDNYVHIPSFFCLYDTY